jgi:hypothetical protein
MKDPDAMLRELAALLKPIIDQILEETPAVTEPAFQDNTTHADIAGQAAPVPTADPPAPGLPDPTADPTSTTPADATSGIPDVVALLTQALNILNGEG